MNKFPLPAIQPSDDGEYWRVRTSHLCGYDHLCDTKEQAATAAIWLTHCVEGLMRPKPVRPHEGACTPESGCDGTCMDAAYLSDRELKQRGPQETEPDMTEFHNRIEDYANRINEKLWIEAEKQSPPDDRTTS